MNNRTNGGIVLMQFIVFSLLATLVGRLFYLQVSNTSTYKNVAAQIQSRDIITPSIRGEILDDQGRPLALDEPGLEITVNRSVIDKLPNHGMKALAKLGLLIGKSGSDLYYQTRLCGELKFPNPSCWKGNVFQPIPVTVHATQNVALKILENQDSYPGINAVQVPVRSYPQTSGENAAHVLGYVGQVTQNDINNSNGRLYIDDLIGKTGLEYQYDQYLRGTPGIRTVIVNRTQAVTSQARNTPEIPGDNLVTNLNAPLQAATEKALETAILNSRAQGHKADSGAAIVEDVKTGHIVALASYPTYDPTIWQTGLTQKQAAELFGPAQGIPALSRPLTGLYPPASTFKVVSVAAATKAGYSMNGTYQCPASIQIGNREFKDLDFSSSGALPMKNLIAVSCDTVWYKIAYDLWLKDGGLFPKSPSDYFFKSAAGFHVGKPTGIDLPGEASGRLPNREWKQNFYQQNKDFYCNFSNRARKSDLTPYLIAIAKENCVDGYQIRAGDAVNFSIGQGDVLITPLQEAAIYSSIANGGVIYQPQVAHAIVSSTGKILKVFKPKVIGHSPLSPSTISFLHSALREVSLSGTAAPIFSNYPIQIAGKTGTGQVIGKNPDGSALDDTSWYASFAPLNSPQYCVVMVISQGGFGASASAVGVRDIYSAIFGVVGNQIDPTKAIFPHGIPGSIITTPRKLALARENTINANNTGGKK